MKNASVNNFYPPRLIVIVVVNISKHYSKHFQIPTATSQNLDATSMTGASHDGISSS